MCQQLLHRVRIQHKRPHPCQDKLIKHLEFPEFLSSLIFYLRPTLFYYQKRAKHQVFPWGSVAINSASCKSLLNSSQPLAALMVSCRRRHAERRCKVEFQAAASCSHGCSAVQHSDHKLKWMAPRNLKLTQMRSGSNFLIVLKVKEVVVLMRAK